MTDWLARAIELANLTPDRAPHVTAEGSHLIAAAEARLGSALPQSVQRFYQHAELARVLSSVYDGTLVGVEELGKDSPPHFPARAVGEVDVLYENQGVCVWRVALSAGHDPPVWVAGDLLGSASRVLYAPTFSEFIFTAAWDTLGPLSKGRPAILAQASELDDQSLDYLRRNFQKLPSTMGWPGLASYRFQAGARQILLRAMPGQCDWFLHAPTLQELGALIRTVLDLCDLRSSLWSPDADGALLIRDLL